MHKLKKVLWNIAFLLFTGLSAGFYTMMEFCGMRGEHPADFCDIYNHALFNPILYLHGILGLVILLDIAFIWLSREKRLLSGKINGRIIVGMLLMGFLILTLLLTV